MKKKTEINGAEVIDLPVPVAKIKEFVVDISELHRMRDKYAILKVDGVKDHTGLKNVTEGRKELKYYRLKIDKRRKELNSDLLLKQRQNNTAAKFIIGELLPTELYLKAIERDIHNQKEEIRLEKKRLKMERLQKRVEQLNRFEVAFDMIEVQDMTDKEFTELLSRAEISFTERQAAKEQNAKKMAEENAKLLLENNMLVGKLKSLDTTDAGNTLNIVVVDQIALPIENTIDKEPDITPEEFANVKLSIKNYALELQRVPLPKIDHLPSKIIFLHGHADIVKGINMLLNSVE